MIEALATQHQVTVLAPVASQGAESQAREGLEGVYFEGYRLAGPLRRGAAILAGALRGWPIQMAFHHHRDLGRALRRLAPRHDLVILQLSRLASHLSDLGETPIVVDFIDCLSLNAARRGRFDRWWLWPALAWESWRLRVWEGRLLERSAAALVVCERDRAAIAAAGDPSVPASRLRVVPIAEEASPRLPARFAEGGAPSVIFTGNLGYFPNRDAAAWLLREVWPLLRERRPEVRLRIAGARPARQLRRWAARVGVSLDVDPPDLKQLIAGATVALAPLRAGSGLAIKVLEAWSMGVPLVASPWTAAGITAEAGEEFLIADSPARWVAAIERLLDEPHTRDRLVAAGRRRLATHYSRESVQDGFLAVVEVATRP